MELPGILSSMSDQIQPLTPEQYQERLLTTVDTELRVGKTYTLLLVSSTIIVTLGLLINSTAVVIGAMLIAPLFWPVLGLTLSLITTRHQLLKKSIINLLFSVIVVMVLSWLITKVSPLVEVTNEIASRTNPTLYDLMIALASSVIGVAAVFYRRISASATGVALSLSLSPPLAVVGIGLAMGRWDIFLASGLLFATNVGAIIFAGIITLYLLGVRPRRKSEKKRFQMGFIASVLFLLVMSIPLSFYLFNTIEQTRIRRVVRTTLAEQMKQIDPTSRVENVQVSFLPRDDAVQLQATAYVSDGIDFTKKQQDELIQTLTGVANRTVDVQLNVVNTVSLRQEEDEYVRALRADVRERIEEWLRDESPGLELDHITVQVDRAITPIDVAPLEVMIGLKQLNGSPFSFEQKETLQNMLAKELTRVVRLEIEVTPVVRVIPADQQKKLEQNIRSTIENDLRLISPTASIVGIQVERREENEQQDLGVVVMVTMIVPEAFEFSVGQKELIQSHLRQEVREPVELRVRMVRYQAL